MTDTVLTLTGWDIATITLLLSAVGFTLFLFGKWDGQREAERKAGYAADVHHDIISTLLQKIADIGGIAALLEAVASANVAMAKRVVDAYEVAELEALYAKKSADGGDTDDR